MTTLVYSKKEGVIAVDGRVTEGCRISSDTYNKYITKGDNTYFIVGGIADAERLIEEVEHGNEEVDTDNSWDCHLILASNPPKEIYVNDMGFIDQIEMLDDYASYGTGGDYALSALDLGRTARQAVQQAMKRDICTGGKIRVFDLNKQKFK